MDYFGPQTRLTGRRGGGRRRRGRRREIKPRYGFLYGCMTLVWNCRDFGMIFVHELDGYEC